jgi:hypothetical protein
MDVVEREEEGKWKCQRRRKERRSSKASKHCAASKPPSPAIPAEKDKQWAAPGKPDTDAAFLKAIASTKRGKRPKINSIVNLII